MVFSGEDEDQQWQVLLSMTVAITSGLILRKKLCSQQPAVRTTELRSQHFCVTGSTSGIGEAVVKELVRRGAGSVVLAVRDTYKGSKLVKELRDVYDIKSDDEITVVGLDLLNVESCRAFSQAVIEGGPLGKTTCLINNAGAMFKTFHVNDRQVEDTMMTNFLAPLYITKALLPTLRKNAKFNSPSRVICTGSKLEKRSELDETTTLDDLRGKNDADEYSLFQAYANSKHGIHLCVNAMADEDSVVKYHTASPGMVNSRLNRFVNPSVLFFTWPLRQLFLNTPEHGAASVLHAATSHEAAQSTAKFYDSNKPEKGGFGVTQGASVEKNIARRVYGQATIILDEVFR